MICCLLHGDGWHITVDLATATVIKYFPSGSERNKNIVTKCTLYFFFPHVINLLLHLKNIVFLLGGNNHGIFLSSEYTVAAQFLCKGVMQKCKRGVLCRLLLVEAQDMFKGHPWALLKIWQGASHYQLADNAGQRSAQAFPTSGKGLLNSNTLENNPRQVRALA